MGVDELNTAPQVFVLGKITEIIGTTHNRMNHNLNPSKKWFNTDMVCFIKYNMGRSSIFQSLTLFQPCLLNSSQTVNVFRKNQIFQVAHQVNG